MIPCLAAPELDLPQRRRGAEERRQAVEVFALRKPAPRAAPQRCESGRSSLTLRLNAWAFSELHKDIAQLWQMIQS